MVAHQFQNLRFSIPIPKQIKPGIKVYYKTRELQKFSMAEKNTYMSKKHL